MTDIADGFKQPVRLTMKTNPESGAKFFVGSLTGTIFTLFTIAFSGLYMGLEAQRMNNFEYDKFK